jgi:hypothetical protein
LHPCLSFVFVSALSHSLDSHFAVTLGSRKNRIDNKFMIRDGKLPLRNSRASLGQTTCQATMILTYNLSGTPPKTWTEIMTNQARLVTDTVR